jgi:hypothetical protein
VLCRAQYSANIGGRNEGIENVLISIYEVGAEVQSPIAYVTDENGQVFLSLIKGKTYSITISYGGKSKTFKLPYNGEAVLLVSIDPKKSLIYDVSFLRPEPSEAEAGRKSLISIENLAYFSLGILLALTASIVYYHWRRIK